MKSKWVGQKIGMLTILGKTKRRAKTKKRPLLWKMKCDCGKICYKPIVYLTWGTIRSCGCQRSMVGKRRGKLIFIEMTSDFDPVKKSAPLYKAKCDCGNICVVRTGRKTCGLCDRKKPPGDYYGFKRGRLTYIKPTKDRRGGSIIWEAKCECGNVVYLKPRSRTKSCGCLNIEKSIQRGKDNRKYTPLEGCARAVWRQNYNDGCDFDTFLYLCQQDCFYCGSPPYNLYNGINLYGKENAVKFYYNGLDRVDNNRTHTTDNIVPCCKICNTMKMSMGVEEFFAHIERIYNNRMAGRNPPYFTYEAPLSIPTLRS
jgi:hypothetical protein